MHAMNAQIIRSSHHGPSCWFTATQMLRPSRPGFMLVAQASQQDAETLRSQLGDASQERDSLRVQLRQKTEQLLSKEQRVYHMEREGELLRKQMADEQSTAREELDRLAQEHAQVGVGGAGGRWRWWWSALRGLWHV
jgi:hypothetical protein